LILRKIFKTGNSTVISIPKEILDYLHLQEGSEVSVELDRERGRIVIRPLETSLAEVWVDEYFARQVEAFIEQYRPVLEMLANQGCGRHS
jgi:putative addiction module antidote